MVERLLEQFRTQPGATFVEVPVNYYGWRWVTDIVRFRPGPVCGAVVEPFEVETRLTEVNTTIRRVHRNGTIYPDYLRTSKDLEAGGVLSWLVVLATRENAKVLASHANTFAEAFNGHRSPDGSRSALLVLDPLRTCAPRPFQVGRLLQAGCLEGTLEQLCPYDDKLDFERQWRRGQQRGEN